MHESDNKFVQNFSQEIRKAFGTSRIRCDDKFKKSFKI
jgi:hypothetical protein